MERVFFFFLQERRQKKSIGIEESMVKKTKVRHKHTGQYGKDGRKKGGMEKKEKKQRKNERKK